MPPRIAIVFFFGVVIALLLAAFVDPMLGAGAFVGIAIVGFIIDGLMS